MSDLFFKISPNIILGSYTASRIGQFAKDWGTRYIVILDPVLKESGATDSILKSLSARKVEYFVFDEIKSAVDSETVKRVLSLAREAHIHGVIGVGGSSVMNLARAVSAIYNEVHDLYDFLDGSTPTSGALPLISVPTTIRNMFIFTESVPVVDARNRQLKLIKVQNGLCKLVLFDSNLNVSLTENQVGAISIDSLCLATEAYLSQKASFFSDMLAEKAVESLGYAMDGSNSLNISATPTTLLIQGGCVASLASATSSIGPASLLGLAISARYNVSHALVATILLPYVIEDVAKYKADRIAKIARIMNLVDEDTSPEEVPSIFAENIRHRLAHANLPARLKDLSLTMEQLSLAAEDAGQMDLINGMPRSMTADDLFELIKLAY
ncbi:MAG: iron-containing alcohol dehydrogenase [Spirochaetaceae bacterium]|nr:iron-containing alcohol dehydrogenase [Spirochaetaceae bacterium]MBO5236969.1 iron-containing alcohol dehydrogenase [Spirochaetaceae bacterium]